MKKSLTIEDLKERIGKPVFVTYIRNDNKNWRVLGGIGACEKNTLEFTDGSSIQHFIGI